MNQLLGQIKSVLSSGQLSLVVIECGEIQISSVIIDTPATVNYLNIGQTLTALFKETEVVISTDLAPSVSLQNQIPCVVQSIEEGQILSTIRMKYNNELITSVISTSSTKRLNIEAGQRVLALIKTNEIMLAP